MTKETLFSEHSFSARGRICTFHLLVPAWCWVATFSFPVDARQVHTFFVQVQKPFWAPCLMYGDRDPHVGKHWPTGHTTDFHRTFEPPLTKTGMFDIYTKHNVRFKHSSRNLLGRCCGQTWSRTSLTQYCTSWLRVERTSCNDFYCERLILWNRKRISEHCTTIWNARGSKRRSIHLDAVHKRIQFLLPLWSLFAHQLTRPYAPLADEQVRARFD